MLVMSVTTAWSRTGARAHASGRAVAEAATCPALAASCPLPSTAALTRSPSPPPARAAAVAACQGPAHGGGPPGLPAVAAAAAAAGRGGGCCSCSCCRPARVRKESRLSGSRSARSARHRPSISQSAPRRTHARACSTEFPTSPPGESDSRTTQARSPRVRRCSDIKEDAYMDGELVTSGRRQPPELFPRRVGYYRTATRLQRAHIPSTLPHSS